MKKLSVLFFLLVLLFSSCGQLILRYKFHGRAFKPRTTAYLLDYLNEHNVYYDYHFRIREEAFRKLSKEPYKPGWSEGFRIPQYRVFDNTGKLIAQWAICEWFIDSLHILDNWPPANNGELNDLNLITDLAQYKDEKGASPLPVLFEVNDATFIIYYTRAVGDVNMKCFDPVNRYRLSHPDKKIAIVLVAVDPETDWKKRH